MIFFTLNLLPVALKYFILSICTALALFFISIRLGGANGHNKASALYIDEMKSKMTRAHRKRLVRLAKVINMRDLGGQPLQNEDAYVKKGY